MGVRAPVGGISVARLAADAPGRCGSRAWVVGPVGVVGTYERCPCAETR